MANSDDKQVKSVLREWGPTIAIMITLVGAAWSVAWSVGSDIRRLEGKVEQNGVALERNAQALERNAQALERNAQAIERIAQATAKLQEGMANLTGQYVEHVRHHNEALANR